MNISNSENLRFITAIVMVAGSFLSASVAAQKGVGDAEGVAQRAEKPPIVAVSGELLEIRTGPCERSMGPSPEGTHLIVQSSDETPFNIHLGPAEAVDHVVDQLVLGQFLSLDAFRTDKMPDNAYIAKSLQLDDKVIHLRDNNLRPSWAYPRGKAQGKRPERRRWGPCW